MGRPSYGSFLARTLNEVAADYQLAEVIPHCSKCARPCCRLDSLVLELNWKQLRSFWRLEESRASFDRRLAAGGAPGEIRAGNGLYYVHRKACPAYDETSASCRVYGQEIKPAGCTDFPVYEDGRCIVADLRCEAVNIKALIDRVLRALGPDHRVVRSADEEFPFLVSLSVRRSGHRNKTS